MACLQLARSGFVPTFRSLHQRHRCGVGPAFLVSCRLGGDNNGEESPESLFMKELKRRGMTPGSLLEKDIPEAERGTDSKAGPTGSIPDLEFEKDISDQRKRSMALNSEGIEGLIPRAKLLLSIGSTFFLGFWPLIMLTFGLFAILYFASRVLFGSTIGTDSSPVWHRAGCVPACLIHLEMRVRVSRGGLNALERVQRSAVQEKIRVANNRLYNIF